MDKNAVISGCGTYRYNLLRRWDYAKPCLYWMMLNPSTADADTDDPTINRCMGFARRGNYGGIHVVNLFAFRATNPFSLIGANWHTVGPQNDDYIRRAVDACGFDKSNFIAAWGAHGTRYPQRVARARELLPIRNTYSLGPLTKHGQPKHPLYLPYDIDWEEYQV